MLKFLKAAFQPSLEQQHDQALEQAMQAQRNGDITLYQQKIKLANDIWLQLKQTSTKP